MAPQPVHWNRPPQSPVSQLPLPPWKTHPVRPQNRPLYLFGTRTVTLWPGASFHPVRLRGRLVSGDAASQMVWFSWFTNVNRRKVAVAGAAATVELGTAAAELVTVAAAAISRCAGARVVRGAWGVQAARAAAARITAAFAGAASGGRFLDWRLVLRYVIHPSHASERARRGVGVWGPVAAVPQRSL